MHRKIWGVDIEPEVYNYLLLGPSLTAAQIATLNANVRLIKYSTGITLASVTAKMSIASPYLVTTSSVDLRPYALIPGVQIVYNDGAKTSTFTGNTPGSGETLDSNLLASVDFTSGWTPLNSTINSASTFTITALSGAVFKDIVTKGALYVAAFTASVSGGEARMLNSGELIIVVSGATPTYKTMSAADNQLRFYNTGGGNGATFTQATANLQKVLTANTTGFNATACTPEAGFNADAASFTATITKP